MKKLALLGAVGAAMVMAAPAIADNHSDKKQGVYASHDTNGDGVISKSEFLNAHEKRFEKMDVNGDGELSKEELKESREERREKMKEKREKVKEYRDSVSE